MVKKPTPSDLAIPGAFKSPNHPANVKNKKYQELEYRVHNIEFTMEFYLYILKGWAQPGELIFSAFAGLKISIASVVNTLL